VLVGQPRWSAKDHRNNRYEIHVASMAADALVEYRTSQIRDPGRFWHAKITRNSSKAPATAASEPKARDYTATRQLWAQVAANASGYKLGL
jgi:hypothetical protein